MLGARSLAFLLSVLQISRAIDVYLNPQNSFLHTTLSPEEASSALSRHLGVEVFEPFHDASVVSDETDTLFVGRGPRNALLLTIDEIDVDAVLPYSLKPSFELSSPSSTPLDTLTSVISTYLHRAQHTYASVYNAGTSWQLEDVDSLATFFESEEGPAFAAAEFTRLSRLRQTYGISSKEYILAATQIRTFLKHIYDEAEDFHMAIITFSPSLHSYEKRQQPPQVPLPSPPPHEPIGAVSTCFTSVNACVNGTNSCSGRGQCLEASKSGRTCFVCTCGATKTGEGSKVKTETWVGQACERKDISGPFVLLTGTAVVMIILVFGSISLLSSVGDHELPSTLLATAVNPKRE